MRISRPNTCAWRMCTKIIWILKNCEVCYAEDNILKKEKWKLIIVVVNYATISEAVTTLPSLANILVARGPRVHVTFVRHFIWKGVSHDVH